MTSVANGIDNRVHLTRIHAPHCTHGGAGPITQSDSQTSDTLPGGLLRSVRTARQRLARTQQQLTTGVSTNAGGSVHTQRRAARTIAVYIHRPAAPLPYEQSVLAGAAACATRARKV